MTKIRLAIVTFVAANVLLAGLYAAGLFGSASPDIDRVHDAPSEDAVRVLFVGNSHVFTHDVPGLLSRLGESGERGIWVEQQVVGGASLADHRESGRAEQLIEAKRWDFVVLQEQSLRPFADPDGYLRDLGYFAKLVRSNHSVPVIYATWARAPWATIYKREGGLANPTQLRNGLNASFREAKRQNSVHGIRLAPVGPAWFDFRRRHPRTPLHSQDGNHATLAGAYLAAAVFYRVTTGEPTANAEFVPDGLKPDIARRLRETADEAVAAPAPRPTPNPTRTTDKPKQKTDAGTRR